MYSSSKNIIHSKFWYALLQKLDMIEHNLQ